MGEIINTGLGWKADEDWLMQNNGLMGSFTQTAPGITSPAVPDVPTNVKCDYLKSNGMLAWNTPYNNSAFYVGVVGTSAYPVYLVQLYRPDNTVWQELIVSQGPFKYAWCYRSSAGSTAAPQVNVTSPWSDTGVYINRADDPPATGFEAVSSTTNVVATSTDLNTAIRNDVVPLLATAYNTFYKLNSGYAVACFARWINANLDEMQTPILISTDPDFVKLSLDGTTETAGILTGIQFGGMTFYINILTGYAGTISTNVPVADLRSAHPEGQNITDLFMSIVNLAKIDTGANNDPYEEEGGESSEAGGGGTSEEGEDVDFTPLPAIGAMDTGLVSLFNPTAADLRALSSYLWSSAFDVDSLKKIFANPQDIILGLSMVPVNPPLGSARNIKMGNIDTGISMTEISYQYVTHSCGEITIPERWGSYLDYSPFTKTQIFLPYIGFRPIDIDDIMGKTVSLRYSIDLLSGACVAELKCSGTILYSFPGQCAAQLPITGNDWTSLFSSAISVVAAGATLLLSEGTSAPAIAGAVAASSQSALSMKPTFTRSGSVSGAAGFLASQTAYLVRSNPVAVVPSNQNRFTGYPSFITKTLGDIRGYNEIDSVHLEGIPATKAEIAEIETLLKGGVIL